MLTLSDKENVGAINNRSKIPRSPLTPARQGLAFRENILETKSIDLSADTRKEEDVACDATADTKTDDDVAVEAAQGAQTTEHAADVSNNAERDASDSAAEPLEGTFVWQAAARRASPMRADMSPNAQTDLQRMADLQGAASKEHPPGKSVSVYVSDHG